MPGVLERTLRGSGCGKGEVVDKRANEGREVSNALAQASGAGRGQGRKTIAPTGEQMKARPVRMTDAQWQKCKALGGAAWVRRMIDEAATPNTEVKGGFASE